MGRRSLKQQLVERTLDVWLTQGFEGASVNDLVAAAGVPKGSFYNHFSSKEEFAVAHVHRYVHTLGLDALTDAEGPALEAIQRHFQQLVAAGNAARMQPACLLGTFSTGVSEAYPELLAAVSEGFAQWIDALAAALTRARDAGEVATDREPADLAAALVDSFEGAVGRARVTGHSQPLDTFISTTVEVLTHAS